MDDIIQTQKDQFCRPESREIGASPCSGYSAPGGIPALFNQPERHIEMATKYRKIDPRIWNDEKFMGLSESGKLVFMFLLTHPNMTSLGAMRHTLSGMAEEIGSLSKDFREAFREVFGKGMVKADFKASFVWLPNFLKYNPPESPNVVKSWENALQMIPECGLYRELIEYVKVFTKDLPKAFMEALPEVFRKTSRKGMPNQEQEQEKEKELEIIISAPQNSKNETLEETAVGVYLDVLKNEKYLNAVTWSMIEENIIKSPKSFAFWRKLVTAWAANGWNPRNVQGMIECYKRREIPKGKAAPVQPEPEGVKDEMTPEELARISARRKELKAILAANKAKAAAEEAARAEAEKAKGE